MQYGNNIPIQQYNTVFCWNVIEDLYAPMGYTIYWGWRGLKIFKLFGNSL